MLGVPEDRVSRFELTIMLFVAVISVLVSRAIPPCVSICGESIKKPLTPADLRTTLLNIWDSDWLTGFKLVIRNKAIHIDPHIVIVVAVALLSISFGCKPANTPPKDTSVPYKTSIDSAGQPALEVGKMRLDFDQPVELENAKLTFVRSRDGRPSAVQIANYDITQTEHEYPAVLFHGTTDLTHSRSLDGQTIEFVMYYQESESSMIATTNPGESVRLSFRALGKTGVAILVALEPVELISADNQILPVAGGQITAVSYDWMP